MTTPAPAPVVAVAEVFRALASPKRLQILEWLRDLRALTLAFALPGDLGGIPDPQLKL